jgi:trigger factor
MRATAQPIEGNKVKLSVEVDEQEMDRAVDTAFKRLAKEVRVPGFRPGKVPRRYLEARIGAGAIRQEALRDSLPDFYSQALVDTDVEAIAPPDIDITAGEEAGATVSIAGYQGLQVTLPSLTVDDADVDAQVDRMRDQFGELQTVSRPAKDGDHVTIDIRGTRHDEVVEGLTTEDFSYEVGSGTIVPEADEQLRGAKVGDILRFTSTVGEETLSFQVLVKEVKEKVLPEANDAWAQEASEFDTLEELRDNLRERQQENRRRQAQQALRDRTLEALVELVETEPPERLVDQELEQRVHDLGHRLQAQGLDLSQYLAATGQDQEALLGQLRQAATQGVKADLALRALADAESISVSEEELDAELGAIAGQLGRDPAQVRAEVERAERLPAVRSDVRKGKALTWLVDRVELVDETGQAINRDDVFPPAEAEGTANDEQTVGPSHDEATGDRPTDEPSTSVESPA